MADRSLDAFRQSVSAAARDLDTFRATVREADRAARETVNGAGVGGSSGSVAGGAARSAAAGAATDGLAGAAAGAIAGGLAGAEATAIKAAIDEGVALLSVGVKTFLPDLVNAVKGIQDARNAQDETVSLAQEAAAFGVELSAGEIQSDFDANLAANKRRTAARTRVEGQLGNESGIIAAANGGFFDPLTNLFR